MTNLDELNEIAECAAECEEKYNPLYARFLRNVHGTPFPYTYRAMFGFLPRIESIRHGVFHLVERREYYSEKILFRSLCEHFLRFQYINLRFINEKADDVGMEYTLLSQAKEHVDYGKSVQYRIALMGHETKTNPIDVIRKYNAKWKDLSEEEMYVKAKRFSYRNMVESIGNFIGDQDSGEIPFLGSMISGYSELSSYVHGGPNAGIETALAYGEGGLSFGEDPEVALQMSLFAKVMAFSCFSKEEPEFFSLAKALRDLVERIGGDS